MSWQVGGREIALHIRRSRRRTVALRVTERGVTLHAPLHLHEGELLAWLGSKRDWLERALHHFARRTPPRYTFADGEALPFLGGALTLRHSARSQAERVGDTLEVPAGDLLSVRRAVEAWYRAQALALFTPLSHELAGRIGAQVGSVKLTEARGRWGSCTASGVLRFHWRVLLAPPEVAHYLCAHEVAHLREFNHSARFWRLVAELAPQHGAARRFLRDEGWRLSFGDHE